MRTENIDPYSLDDVEFSTHEDDLLRIAYPDIVGCLVFSPSPNSSEDVKKYKSLSVHNQVMERWTRDVRVLITSSGFKGKINKFSI